jgi:hypothetical protein
MRLRSALGTTERKFMAKREKRPLTGFGKALRQFMVREDIDSWSQLSDEIQRTTNRKYAHQSISKYAVGANSVPVEFVQDFADALDLSKQERVDLAVQLTFHSRPEIPGEEGAKRYSA